MPLTILELCSVLKVEEILLLVFPRIISEFSGSKFLLPTLPVGGKQNFQVANLLPATVNFEYSN